MPLYITLMKLTEQGIKNIKDAPERAKQGFKGFFGFLGLVKITFRLILGTSRQEIITEI